MKYNSDREDKAARWEREERVAIGNGHHLHLPLFSSIHCFLSLSEHPLGSATGPKVLWANICQLGSQHDTSMLTGLSKGSVALEDPAPVSQALDKAEERCKAVVTETLYMNHSYLMANSYWCSSVGKGIWRKSIGKSWAQSSTNMMFFFQKKN